MSNLPTPIVGGMGSMMDGPELGGNSPQLNASLEIGVLEDKIGFKVTSPNAEPVVMLFTLPEIYNIMGALESAMSHVRQSTMQQFSQQAHTKL